MYVSEHEINPFPYYYDWEERITQEKAFFYWIGSTIPVFLCIYLFLHVKQKKPFKWL